MNLLESTTTDLKVLKQIKMVLNNNSFHVIARMTFNLFSYGKTNILELKTKK